VARAQSKEPGLCDQGPGNGQGEGTAAARPAVAARGRWRAGPSRTEPTLCGRRGCLRVTHRGGGRMSHRPGASSLPPRGRALAACSTLGRGLGLGAISCGPPGSPFPGGSEIASSRTGPSRPGRLCGRPEGTLSPAQPSLCMPGLLILQHSTRPRNPWWVPAVG
jgi:hypothetical protein